MRQSRINASCFTLVFVLSVLLPQGTARAVDADSLHWAAWDHALAAAGETPAVRYAFYAYRTLAVPHPEVYLLADALFSEIVETIPGSRVAFRGGNQRDVELFRRLLNGEQQGPSFAWRMWAPVADSIFDSPEQNETMSWLDRRLAPAGVILLAISPWMSTAEAAVMRYTQLRRAGDPESSLFVLIDTSGLGYLAHDNKLISAATGREWDGDPSTVVPALVFNERSVYYPLFGRDDRETDSALARLVDGLRISAPLTLSAEDQVRIEQLRSAASLGTASERRLAVISALGGIGIENAVLRDAWHAALGAPETFPLDCEKGMFRMVIYWADRLSRKTALLAAAAPEPGSEFGSAAPAWEETYLAWCGHRVNPKDTADLRFEAGGYLWAYELLELTFDDIVRTHSGGGSSHSLAMAAALDLLGISNLRLEVDMPEARGPDQYWTLAEEGRWQFNLGTWRRIRTDTDSFSRRPLFLASYGIEGRWVNLRAPAFFSDADQVTIHEDLTRMAVVMPSVKLVLRSGHQSVMPLAELMLSMNEGTTDWRALPWPEPEGAAEDSLEGSR